MGVLYIHVHGCFVYSRLWVFCILNKAAFSYTQLTPIMI